MGDLFESLSKTKVARFSSAHQKSHWGASSSSFVDFIDSKLKLLNIKNNKINIWLNHLFKLRIGIGLIQILYQPIVFIW